MSGSPRPPRWAARVLEALLPPTEKGAAILGDLHEEFVARAGIGRWRATLWYLRAGAGIAARYAAHGRRYRRRPSRLENRGNDRRWDGMMDAFTTNLRYATRRMLRSPMFTAVAVASLGLGIGANTAMFSLVNAAVIRDMPFTEPERLVDVYLGTEDFSHGTLSYPDYLDFEEETRDVFEAVGGMQITFVQVDTDEGVELVTAETVTGNYFSILGVQPAVGRLLSSEDHVARGAHPVTIISHDYWASRYGADPSVVGSEIRLAGRAYTIIGVAPESFRGSVRGLEPGVYVPIMMHDELMGAGGNIIEARGNQSFFGKARLRPGATLDQAEAIADRITRRLREEYPTSWSSDKRFVLVATADVIMNPMIDRFIKPAAGTVMAVVGLVLLIACANLASFLLARAADRRKEIAVRLAMGAKRRTLMGQLLTETILLSAIGGLLGVWLAVQSLDALVRADLPLPLPVTLDLSLDRVVLGFSVLVSVAAGLLFGLAPALQSTNPDVAPTLRDETAGGGRARGAHLRNALVVGQVAVSVVLLVGAGLFLRSLDASRTIDPGFGAEPSGILQLVVPADRYDEEEGEVFLASLTERIARISGVRRVGFIDNLHLNQLSNQWVRLNVDGVDPPPGADFHQVDFGVIDPGFLDAAGIPLVAGRSFDARDDSDAEEVALVTEEFVRRFLPDRSPLGSSIVVNGRPVVVVGVTADHKVRQLSETTRPFVYLHYRQTPTNFVTLVATTAGDDERLALEMMAAARELDPQMIVIEAKTMRRHLAILLLGRELGAMVVGGFALLALLLASIGLYGVVSYAVSRRAREVGIRLSLGAEAGSVVRMLTGGGMKLVAAGALVGLIVAAGASQLLSRLLYGVPPLDLVTFITVPTVLGAVAFLAAWVPARRATRIDPVRALRAE